MKWHLHWQNKPVTFEKALEYHELYANYVDSVILYKEQERLMEWQKKYDYSLLQNENIYLKAVR